MVNSCVKRVVNCAVIVAFLGTTTGLLQAKQTVPTVPQVVPQLEAGTAAEGMRDGELLGSQRRSARRFGVGLVVGGLSGPLGALIGHAAIGPDKFSPEAVRMTEGKSLDYQVGFKASWERKTQAKKRKAFLTGGLLGGIAFSWVLISGGG